MLKQLTEFPWTFFAETDIAPWRIYPFKQEKIQYNTIHKGIVFASQGCVTALDYKSWTFCLAPQRNSDFFGRIS